MKPRDIPNIISLLRIALVIPVVYLLLEREFSYALVLFFVAGFSDALDGYLAKRNQWKSRLGSILDPLADKLLLVFSYLALGWLHEIPMWLVIAVMVRDVVIVVGAIAYHELIGEYDMLPTWMSKTNTFFQIMLVLAVVFSLGAYTLPGWLIDTLIYTVAVTTLVSGFNYVWVWGRRAIAAKALSAE
ncbi:MAG: CDP-alcohol phosphatidyltransferase family protein [Gammaproteobacteria bacterium]|nr:CDP-alcohol phosphatidyltransferase family protein [Gammaproteobacteria bacterium]